MAKRNYTLGDLAKDKAKRRQAPRRLEERSREESVSERIARLDESGFFKLEPTEPISRGAQRYAAEKLRKHVRRVRSPRFSDDEFGRVERQAVHLESPDRGSLMRRADMTPLEFIRVATMAVVGVLERLPVERRRGIWDMLEALAPSSGAARGPAAGVRNAPAHAPRGEKPQTLDAEGFEKGTEGVCYVCGLPAVRTPKDGLTHDYIGQAHNRCLVKLRAENPRLYKKRNRLQDALHKAATATLDRKKSRPAAPAPAAERPDCAKCNDAGHYEERGEEYTCTCKHGLGDDPDNPPCALCEGQGKSDGIHECPCKRGALMTEFERQARKAGAS